MGGSTSQDQTTYNINCVYLLLTDVIPEGSKINYDSLHSFVQSISEKYQTELDSLFTLVSTSAALGCNIKQLKDNYADLKYHYNNKNTMDINVNEQISTMAAVKEFFDSTHAMLDNLQKVQSEITNDVFEELGPTLQWMYEGSDKKASEVDKPPILLQENLIKLMDMMDQVNKEVESKLSDINDLVLPLADIEEKEVESTSNDADVAQPTTLSGILTSLQQDDGDDASKVKISS